jgi:hypothetical protein
MHSRQFQPCVEIGIRIKGFVGLRCLMAGIAGAHLLMSYSLERQPVGADLVQGSNEALRRTPVFLWGDSWPSPLPPEGPDPLEISNAMHELSEATPEGALRRKNLRHGVESMQSEYHGLGREMNHQYRSSAIINERDPFVPFDRDPVLYYQRSTYPGRRLPHVWLKAKVDGGQFISTIDLAGKGAFTLFTGIGGDIWKTSAVNVSKNLGVPINAYSIGIGQDYNDIYFDWAGLREIEDNGCIFTRPDRFVAWRSRIMIPDVEERLTYIMKTILVRSLE